MKHVALTRCVYDAFERHDGVALAGLLATSFTARVSDGLPVGGGAIPSPEAMLQLWGRADRAYDIVPKPEEMVPLADGRVLVLGQYIGTARATGKQVQASFAHVWRFADDRAVSLVQITDTARWRDALS